VCYSHPGQVYSSMRSEPSVLCFDSPDHTAMLVTGIAAFALTPLPFLSVAVFAMWRYPHYVAMRSINFMKAFRFLFFRYEPSAYFFGVALLLRNLLVCLVPVVIRDDTAAQILAVSVIMLVGVVAQCLLRPWRNHLANILDGAMTGCILLVLVCGAVIGGYTASEATTRAMSVLVVASFLSMWVGLITWNVYKQLNPSDVCDMFICHHKVGGAAQARLIKLMVADQAGQRVCMDSDYLLHLDTLFDTVKAKVQHLVIYLTRDTLTRPWCAGEIVTALKTGRRVTAVMTPSFVAPTEEQLDAVGAYLEIGGADLLVQYGIAMSDVRDSYTKLVAAQGCSHVQVESGPANSAQFQDLVDRLLQNHTKAAPAPQRAAPGCLVVSADPYDPEAAAAACILMKNTQDLAPTFLNEGLFFLSDHMDMGITGHCLAITAARSLVVILSTETLSSCHQLDIIAHATGLNEKGQGPAIIPADIFGFRFPSAHYYSQVLPQIWQDVSEAQVRHIEMFFCAISCPYTTHASDQVLQTQTEAIIRRISQGRTTCVHSFMNKGSAGTLATLTSGAQAASGTGSQAATPDARPMVMDQAGLIEV